MCRQLRRNKRVEEENIFPHHAGKRGPKGSRAQHRMGQHFDLSHAMALFQGWAEQKINVASFSETNGGEPYRPSK